MASIPLDNEKTLAGLRRRWVYYALAGGLFFAGGFFCLIEWWEPAYAGRWLGLSLAVFLYELWVVWKNLKANHRAGEVALLSGLGTGNLASLFRGTLIAALYGFLFSPLPDGWLAWLPGVLYTTAALADGLDGVLARLANHTTKFGEIMDMYFDGLGMLVATGLIVQAGRVPAWYLLIGMVRYFFLFGMWLRVRLGKTNHLMPPSVRRRGMAAVQMGFVSVMVWPLFSPPATQVVAYVFGLPLLVGFLWDWLYVSGVISPEGIARYKSWANTFWHWAPVGLRLGVLACALPALLNQAGFSWIEWVVYLLLLIGAAGRVASIAGLIALGFLQLTAPLTSAQLLQGILYALILLLGTGAFSAWKPEDVLIYKKVGEKPLGANRKTLEGRGN
jgi:CDP-diacylglycerol--glycerol-3-phosphate 3-phosphatidyltransferase